MSLILGVAWHFHYKAQSLKLPVSKPLCDVVCLSPALWGEGSNKWVHLLRVIACRALTYIFHTSGKSTLDPPNNSHFKLTHCSNSWDHFQPDSAWGTLCSRQLVLGSEMWKMIPLISVILFLLRILTSPVLPRCCSLALGLAEPLPSGSQCRCLSVWPCLALGVRAPQTLQWSQGFNPKWESKCCNCCVAAALSKSGLMRITAF